MRPIVRPGRSSKLAAAGALGLQLVREVEQGLELVASPGSDASEASALQVLGDSGHEVMLGAPGSFHAFRPGSTSRR